MDKKNLLRELIDHYLAFSESDYRQDLGSFSDWLRDRTQPASEAALEPLLETEVEHKGLELTIAEHWGRLAQYAAIWSKLAFEELPVKTFAEYGLLKYIALLKHPTKSELVELSLLEKSTCYEIIRRLQQMALIEEARDTEDKRIRRVKLTASGKKWVTRGDEQLEKIAHLFVGDLNRESQSHLLRMLMQLNDFHARLYRQDQENVRKKYF